METQVASKKARTDLELMFLWDIMDSANPFITENGNTMDCAKEMIETALRHWFMGMTLEQLAEKMMELKTAEL